MNTAIDFLIEWTENKSWKKHLLNTVLQNKEIDINDITTEIIDIISNNKIVNLYVSQSQATIQTQLYIKEIKNPININALYSETCCKFGRNINVFYGENGTGKSSYVKIFRKLADNFYTNEKNLNVMSNVYNDTKTIEGQTITVCYSCDDNESCNQCIDINIKHSDLSKINVFDSSSVNPLLNTDLTFSVLPQGFNYFSQLTDLVDNIKAKIQELVNSNQLEQDKIFIDSSFSIITEDIANITSNVPNVSKLEAFLEANYFLPKDIDIQIEGLDNKIKELQSTNPADKIKILSTQKLKLEAIKKNFNILSGKVNCDNINAVNRVIKQYDELIAQEKKYNKDFSSKVQHVARVNNEWTSFVNAAKEYYKSIGDELPSINSPCIFCGQSLEKQHIDLIELCFQHINSRINKSKKEIDKKIQSYVMPELAVTLLIEDEKLFTEDKKNFIEKLKTTISLIDKNKKIFKENIQNKKEVPEECIINFEDIINEITKEIENIDSKIIDLGKSNQEVTELVSSLNSQKNVLLRKKKIHESKDLFIKWYEYKVKIDLLNKMKSQFTTNSLTTKSKEAFKEIVAEDYLDTFNGYCLELGVTGVGISLSSKKGQSKRGKYVVNENIKVTEIMSEGEQKAIALAEFATDLNIRKNYCTTIFDDPVTSFDYKRAEKIADMIYKISKERQVIVFTHNIMFYYYLYNCCCTDKNKENKFFKIDEFDRDNKGLISLSAEGRLENLKGITNKIKDASQRINSKNCLGDELERTLKATYSDIRTWCELIVEEGFLKKIIRRYEPDIKFTFVPKITSEFVNYLPDVSDLFNKSCRYMLGHSQPNETQNVKPSPEEFRNDLDFILHLFEKYKN
ncbi:MAG: AAA family ATPase [Clostridium botulinum]|nr:AAA family ATPase [Clostridium botulinum]